MQKSGCSMLPSQRNTVYIPVAAAASAASCSLRSNCCAPCAGPCCFSAAVTPSGVVGWKVNAIDNGGKTEKKKQTHRLHAMRSSEKRGACTVLALFGIIHACGAFVGIHRSDPMPSAWIRRSVTILAERSRARDVRSGLSRNVPAEKLNRARFRDQDDVLSGEAFGEIGRVIAVWQRTAGPVYIQLAGVMVFLSAFYNYFELRNANGLSSALWSLSVFLMLLGFALQRGDKDRQRPY